MFDNYPEDSNTFVITVLKQICLLFISTSFGQGPAEELLVCLNSPFPAAHYPSALTHFHHLHLRVNSPPVTVCICWEDSNWPLTSSQREGVSNAAGAGQRM